MLSRESKSKLIKVCKVLFADYKYVKISNKKNIAIFSNCKIPIISWFYSKWRISLTELLNFRIPLQLSDFKYNNRTFINFIQDDLVRCEVLGKNKIDYFLDEITKIKYSNLYKQLQVQPNSFENKELLSDEELLFNEMIEVYSGSKVPIVKDRKSKFSIYIDGQTLFYILLLVITAITILF